MSANTKAVVEQCTRGRYYHQHQRGAICCYYNNYIVDKPENKCINNSNNVPRIIHDSPDDTVISKLNINGMKYKCKLAELQNETCGKQHKKISKSVFKSKYKENILEANSNNEVNVNNDANRINNGHPILACMLATFNIYKRFLYLWIPVVILLCCCSDSVTGQHSPYPERLVRRPWVSPSQLIQKTAFSNSISNPFTKENQGRHIDKFSNLRRFPFRGPTIKPTHLSSGVRENPQRISYLSKTKLRNKNSSPNLPNLRQSSTPIYYKTKPYHQTIRTTSTTETYSLKPSVGNTNELEINNINVNAKFSPIYIKTNGSDQPQYIIQHMPTSPDDLNSIGNQQHVTLISRAGGAINLTTTDGRSRSRWDALLDPNVCRKIAGLTREQLQLCHKHVDVTGAAALGMKLGVRECQNQLRRHRWNCSSLATRTNNPYSSAIMATGYSESGFGHAMVSAGVAHSVARACSAGVLNTCSCGKVGTRQQWQWSGCHDNTRYGAKFSRLFLDVREKGRLDSVAYSHLHNNELGRKIVRRQRAVQCKCHGMSGSCELRTCWKAAPEFKRVGDLLRKKYKKAQMIKRQNNRNRIRRKIQTPDKRTITPQSSLLYASYSPSFCDHDSRLHHPGTHGRQCNATGNGPDSCRKLCCGRGYTRHTRTVLGRCNCHFKWCCKVTCQDCSVVQPITRCN